MRLFVALEIPHEIASQATAVQSTLKATHAFIGTFPHKSQLHITLAFMPNVQLHDLHFIQNAVERTIQSYTSFIIEGMSIACVPKHTPRLIWLTLYQHYNNNRIEQLAHDIYNTLHHFIAGKEYEFIPHITLARIKNIRSYHDLKQALTGITFTNTLYTINRISIKQSELTAQGPHYTTLASYILKTNRVEQHE